MTGDLDPAMAHAIRVVIDQKVVPDLVLPAEPSDGDCLDLAPRVTALLNHNGIPARTATVCGWQDPDRTTVVFLHKVSLIDGAVVADATARRFSTAIPGAWLWVTTRDNYCQKLATLAGVAVVTIQPDPVR